MYPWAGLTCGGAWREKPHVPVGRCAVALWCLVSVWGCAHPVVQLAKEERSAIAFAKQVVTEMSTGLDKLRASVVATVTEKGTYRIFTGEFFPHDVTMTDMMNNFARLCTQIGGSMSQAVCKAREHDEEQVKFVVHAEAQATKPYVKIHVTVYEPVGAPSAEFLQAIRPYR